MRDHLLHRRMVDAEHREAVERHAGDELVVARGHRLDVAPVVQMLGVHVGDDGDGRGQAQEAAVALVRFNHHPVAGTEPGIGAVGVDDAAVDHRRIEPRRLQHVAIRLVVVVLPCVPPTAIDHFSRISSASISARGTTGISRARAAALRGCRADRARHDHDAGIAEIGRVVADGDLDAGFAQAADVRAIGDVAALHGIAEIVQHLGDPGHADAADADEMHGPMLSGSALMPRLPRRRAPRRVGSPHRPAARRRRRAPPRGALRPRAPVDPDRSAIPSCAGTVPRGKIRLGEVQAAPGSASARALAA